MNRTLIFEGAGCTGTGTKEVPNCRIRTRIRNNEGRLIYLEMGGIKFEGKNIPKWSEGFNFTGRVDHCFYCDSKWDERRNHSSDLIPVVRMNFEYNRESILKLVNEKLNCSFETIEVINDNSIRVHDTKEPLCDCSNKNYKPYEDIEININILDGIKPIMDYKERGFAQYKINYDFVKKHPYIRKWINERSSQEQEKFKNFTYYINLIWDKNGIINSMELSSRQNFCTIGLGAEDLQNVINTIIEVSKEALTA